MAPTLRWAGPFCAILIASACSQRFEFDVPDSNSNGAGARTMSSYSQPGGSTSTSLGGSGGGTDSLDNGGNGVTPVEAGGTSNSSSSAGAAGTAACTTRCGDLSQNCAPDWQICVECNTDSDCSGTRMRCGVGALAHRCVECRASNDSGCPSDAKCDVPTGRCIFACHLYDDGKIDDHYCLAGSTCTTASGFCSNCSYDSNCRDSSAGSYCHPGILVCVECSSNTNCTSSNRFCDPILLTCVACRDGRDCASGVCDAVMHQCS